MRADGAWSPWSGAGRISEVRVRSSSWWIRNKGQIQILDPDLQLLGEWDGDGNCFLGVNLLGEYIMKKNGTPNHPI